MPTASSGDKLPIRYDSSSFIISGDLCCWKKFQNGSIAEPAPIMIFSRPGCSGMNFVISYTPMPYVTQTLLSLQWIFEKWTSFSVLQFDAFLFRSYDACVPISLILYVGKSGRIVLWHSMTSFDWSACTFSFCSSRFYQCQWSIFRQRILCCTYTSDKPHIHPMQLLCRFRLWRIDFYNLCDYYPLRRAVFVARTNYDLFHSRRWMLSKRSTCWYHGRFHIWLKCLQKRKALGD